MQPFLSIITINKNNANGLHRTIESVAGQDFNEVEYIVVDGESTDKSVQIIRSFESKINKWISEPDSGIYHAMNKGIDMASGKYCLFLNSGDWLNKDILNQIEWSYLDQDIIYFDMYRYYSPEKVEIERYPEKLTLKRFIFSNIGHQASFIKHELLLKAGKYNLNYLIHGDFEFWLKALIEKRCTTKHFPLVLSYYDMNGKSSEVDSYNKFERDDILNSFIPKAILNDYYDWYSKEKDFEILNWYRGKKNLYKILKFTYKINKRINDFFNLSIRSL